MWQGFIALLLGGLAIVGLFIVIEAMSFELIAFLYMGGWLVIPFVLLAIVFAQKFKRAINGSEAGAGNKQD
jgi:hypothetical protein